MAEQDGVAERFTALLAAWRATHPGWTEREQMERFPAWHLWRLAGGRVATDQESSAAADRALYVRLMRIAGYLVPQREGADG